MGSHGFVSTSPGHSFPPAVRSYHFDSSIVICLCYFLAIIDNCPQKMTFHEPNTFTDMAHRIFHKFELAIIKLRLFITLLIN